MRQLALLLFYAGWMLIPFDNLRIAPSLGWAAVSPYFFFASAVLFVLWRPREFAANFLRVKVNRAILLQGLVFLSFLSYLAFGLEPGLVGLTAFKLLLGLGLLVSFSYVIFLVQADERRGQRISRKLISMLAASYLLAVLCGLAQYLAILGWGPALPFDLVFARFYPEKVQFSFTEPSFVSLHVLGIIVPTVLILAPARSRARTLLLACGVLLLLISIVSGSSLRALVDCALFGSGLLLILPSRKKIKAVSAMVCGLAIFLALPSNRLVERVESVLSGEGVADPSALIRKFRSEAALYGMVEHPLSAAIGFGFGNSGQAIESGFDKAYQNMPTSIDLDEIEQLRVRQDGLTYSMHVKLLAEHGLLGYLLLLLMLFDRRRKILFFATFVVYLQFDSYAFYTLWLYIAARIFDRARDEHFVRTVRRAA